MLTASISYRQRSIYTFLSSFHISHKLDTKRGEILQCLRDFYWSSLSSCFLSSYTQPVKFKSFELMKTDQSVEFSRTVCMHRVCLSVTEECTHARSLLCNSKKTAFWSLICKEDCTTESGCLS